MAGIFCFWCHSRVQAIGSYCKILSKNWWFVAIRWRPLYRSQLKISVPRIIRRFLSIHHGIWKQLVCYVDFYYLIFPNFFCENKREKMKKKKREKNQKKMISTNFPVPLADIYNIPHMNDFNKATLFEVVGTPSSDYNLRDPKVQKLINSTDVSFDLVINEDFYHDSWLMFGYKFKAPTVSICELMRFNGFTWYFNGSINETSIIREIKFVFF